MVAASEACRQMFWMKCLYKDILELETTDLKVDNETTVKLAQNLELHRRTKHIQTSNFFVRELVNEEEIKITNVT